MSWLQAFNRQQLKETKEKNDETEEKDSKIRA